MPNTDAKTTTSRHTSDLSTDMTLHKQMRNLCMTLLLAVAFRLTNAEEGQMRLAGMGQPHPSPSRLTMASAGVEGQAERHMDVIINIRSVSTLPPSTSPKTPSHKPTVLAMRNRSRTPGTRRTFPPKRRNRFPKRRQAPEGEDNLANINALITTIIEPTFIAIGIIGNSLIALGFLKTPIQLRPVSHCIGAMGFINGLYALGCLVPYLYSRGVAVYEVPGVCQVSTFVLMVSRSLETWFILLCHINRLNAHTNGAYVRRKKRVFNMKFAVLILSLLAFAPAVHVLWAFESVRFGTKTFCVPLTDTLGVHVIFRKIEIVCYQIVPTLLTIGIDSLMLLKLALTLSCKSSSSDSALGLGEDLYQYTGSRADSLCSNKVTKMPLERRLDTLRETSQESRDQKSSDGVINKTNHPREICSRRTSEPVARSADQLSNVSEHPNEETSDNIEIAVSLHDMTETRDIQIVFSEISSSKLVSSMSSASDGTNCEEQLSCDNINSEKLQETVPFLKASCLSLPDKSSHISIEENSLKQKNAFKKNSSRTEDSQDLRFSLSGVDNFQSSYSISQWKSFDCTSFATIGSRSNIAQADQDYPADIERCTVTVLIIGFAYLALCMPSLYSQSYKLFMDSVKTMPSFSEIQKSIFYESLVKLNFMYKFLILFCMMASFRKALKVLFTQSVTSAIRRILRNVCCWKDGNNDSTIV